MGSVKNKKATSLSRFFLKYFMLLCIGALLIVFCGIVGFNLLFTSNIIYPANYAQQQADIAYDNIANAKQINTDIIPELCQYIIFDTNGTVQDGNIEKHSIENAWEAIQGDTSDRAGNYFKVVPRSDGYCVLRFQMVPQYQSSLLRKYLPAPQTLIMITVSLLLIIFAIIVAVLLGRALTKKLNSLILATQKIQRQELDFSISPSDIKEIDTILSAVNKMRIALKESLQKQWQLEQLRKEQISSLAHDLKTPITIIRGNTDLLNYTTLSVEQKECADYIEDSALQMQKYVATLIEMSKSDSTTTLIRKPLNLDAFLKKLQSQANGLSVAKQIKLLWQVDCIPQNILANTDLLSRAMMNVISNAVDFTEPNGKIIFSAKGIDDTIEFSIIDAGKGFSPKALDNATKQFYMDDESRSSHLHYGMGLYITNTIIIQHGGTMELQNSHTTGGAEVIIKIPQ